MKKVILPVLVLSLITITFTGQAKRSTVLGFGKTLEEQEQRNKLRAEQDKEKYKKEKEKSTNTKDEKVIHKYICQSGPRGVPTFCDDEECVKIVESYYSPKLKCKLNR